MRDEIESDNNCRRRIRLTLHLEAPRGRQVEFFFASWYVLMHSEKTEKTPNMTVVTVRTIPETSILALCVPTDEAQLTIYQAQGRAVSQHEVQ